MNYDERSFLTVTRADHIPGPPQGEWTYASYATIPDDGQRYEIFDGVLYVHPSLDYPLDEPLGLVLFHLGTYVEETEHFGGAFSVPFKITLPEKIMAQSDMALVFKKHKEMAKSNVADAPNLIIDIISLVTELYNRQQKYRAYANAGVQEYWIVDPIPQNVEVLALEGGEYHSIGVFGGEQIIRSQLLPDFSVRARQIFDYR